MADQRKQKRTSQLSVVISLIVHGIIIGLLAFFAAREGMLGKELKKIAVTMVPREKPPEKPKEKPPEPKPEMEKPKVDDLKPAALSPQVARQVAAPSSEATLAPAAAPPSAALPAFDFEGGKTVETTSDPNMIYKCFVEYALRSRWTRPEGLADEHYVAEVEVAVDPEGRVLNTTWKKGSGDAAWDNSVKKALAQSSNIGRPPPRGFPEQVLVRFDVQVATEISFE